MVYVIELLFYVSLISIAITCKNQCYCKAKSPRFQQFFAKIGLTQLAVNLGSRGLVSKFVNCEQMMKS